MTLKCINFQRISQILDTTTAKRMKIDQYCQGVSDNVVSNWMYFSTLFSLRSFDSHYFLADRTNGRTIGTVLRLSVVVCNVKYCG